LLADQPFEGRDPRFVLLKEVGRGSVLVEGARLVSFDPDTDQIAREIVALWSGPLGADRDQAADLTVCRAWWSSNCLGLR
jgi:hypothetical protein